MNYDKLIAEIIDTAKEAGAFIRKERMNFDVGKIEKKGKNDFVSYVDKTSEKIILDRLVKLLPEAGIIAEENTLTKHNKDLNWIVDPLDGTTNFIHGIPCYAVSIGLEEKGKIVAGVVYEINRDECFYAHLESDAFCNEKKISVSAISRVEDSLLVTGFPYYDYHLLDEYLELFKYFMKNSHGLRRLGSAATDLAYVAAGRFEAFYEYSLKPWDVAAGSIIVERAGGSVSDFGGGNNFIYGEELIACNTNIYEELKNVVGRFMK